MSLENTTSNNNKLLLAHYPFPTYIIRNEQVIYETQCSIPEEISVEFASSEEAFWIVFKVRGDGSGKDLKVDCSSSDSNEYTFEEISKDLQIAQNDYFSVNGDNLRFLINSPIAGELTFSLESNGTRKVFSTLQEKKQRNYYSVQIVNYTKYIIRNEQVIYKTQCSIPEEISVEFASSEEAFWIIFKGESSNE
jgi:hypothetical protein